PPLSKAFLLGETTPERLGFRPREFFEKSRISLQAGERVMRIDRARHEVEMSDGKRVNYGKLVLATGSRARTLAANITRDLNGILTLRSVDDAETLRQALVAAKRVLVIGAGYVGLEVAAISAQMRRQVTVVEMAERILKRVACVETSQAV